MPKSENNLSPLELAVSRKLLARLLVTVKVFKVQRETSRRRIAYHGTQALLCRMRANLLPLN